MTQKSLSPLLILVPALLLFLNTPAKAVRVIELPLGTQTGNQTGKRSFGPEQVTGAPDVAAPGDNGSAWASKLQDDQKEWLVCEYDKAVLLKSVSVYETYNPGALYKLTVFDPDGKEVTAWEGKDPTPATQASGISIIPVRMKFPVKKLKLYFDSPSFPGWNEIDAVGITDSKQQVQWASRVTASSTYAQPAVVPQMTMKRGWGPEQAQGKPDTPEAGDQTTAWASSSTDAQKEWLVCEYKDAFKPRQIVVHETYNPGAVYKITSLDKDDKETSLWEGEDPTPRDEPLGISVFPVKLTRPIRKIKIYIDSPAVPGYNEIDAVGLRSGEETRWADKVTASSTFGVTPIPTQPPAMSGDSLRIRKLENQVEELTRELEELKKLKAEIQRLRDELKK
nr:hypothetical protein [Planctomycetota bacterium]